MRVTCPITIHYPLSEGRIVLHTDLGWDDEIEAAEVGDDGTRWEFTVSTERPYFYFKPCLRVEGEELRWAAGTNYLAVTTAPGGRDVYPHFDGAKRGDITRPIDVPGGHAGRGYRIRVYQPPGYDENTLKRYPVLYMHDGANLFFPEDAFMGQEWQVDETMDLLDDMNVIDKVIVVGVFSEDRMNEYTKPGYERHGR